MHKKTIIKKIKEIIANYGSFDIMEVNAECSPCVSAIGNHVHLAEHFALDKVKVSVYAPAGISSDPIDDYEMDYEDLSKEVLAEILTNAELYEVDQEKTIKRCSN